MENRWSDLSEQIQWSAEPEATKWVLYNAGTIMNPRSGLVIAAESSTQRTVLNVAEDNNSSRQPWSANTQPTINFISGFREMCLQANGLSNDIYSLIDSNKIAKDLWDALARHMLDSEYGKQDRKATVLYEYNTFKSTEGELLVDTYIRYLEVINDLKKCGYSKDN
nr:ribosome-inactivating protein [Tanacetum cinerariifolium]